MAQVRARGQRLDSNAASIPEIVMKHLLWTAALLAGGLAGLSGASAQERVDLDVTARIRAEAFHRSQVMATLSHLTDAIGPRLTNSPAMAEANRWTRQQMTAWGLSNVHDEAVEDLGRGWAFTDAQVEMLSPRPMPLHALPKAWTPGTSGAVEGDAIVVKLESKQDLEQWKGKLRGKIVFVDEARAYKTGDKPDFQRYTGSELDDMLAFPLPKDRGSDPAMMARFRARMELAPLLNQYLIDEGVLATVSISSWNDGIVRVMGGGSRKAGEAVGVPALVMAAEHYNTVLRALKDRQPVRLRLQVDARFLDEANQPGYNTIAEIPGSGPQRNEIVMLGAHMDSWHAGSGANDNAAGVAVMMEAMRILKAIGARPNRTIRVALWTGEEQGLIGSPAPSSSGSRPTTTSTTAAAGSAVSTRRKIWPQRPFSRSGCGRGATWAQPSSPSATPAAPTTSVSTRSASPASSSCRIRWTISPTPTTAISTPSTIRSRTT